MSLRLISLAPLVPSTGTATVSTTAAPPTARAANRAASYTTIANAARSYSAASSACPAIATASAMVLAATASARPTA